MTNTKKTATKKSTCCGSKKSDSNVQSSVSKSTKTTARTQSKKSNNVK
ncbi:MAG: hypothetical protein K2I75_06120 [Clostridiales bacterium]|nr:hypothetical protein [Clostridiales bacterium]